MEHLNTLLPVVGTFVVAAYVLAAVGEQIGRFIFPSGLPRMAAGLAGWRWCYVRTWALHPILAGALVGLLPLPVPEFLGPTIWARVLWFTAAGLSSLPIHSAIAKRLDALDGVTGNDGRS